MDEFANIMSMELYGDEQQCNKTQEINSCYKNPKCVWCKPSSMISMGRKRNASCHAKDNLKMVPAAFVDCD